MLRIVLGGVFDRFPGLQMIVGHMGEMLPFMLARIDDFLPSSVTGLERPVSEYVRGNVYVTTAHRNAERLLRL